MIDLARKWDKTLTIALALVAAGAMGFLSVAPSSQPTDNESRFEITGLSNSVAIQAQTGVTDPLLSPIYTPTEAISRSKAILPLYAAVSDSEARLASRSTLITGPWFSVSDSPWITDTAHWIVGIESTGMSLGDAIILPNGSRMINDPDPHLDQPATGSYYVWEAGSGLMISSGGLTPDGYLLSEITALEDEQIPIVHATETP